MEDNKSTLAPIILFAYRRIPKEVATSLLKNDFSKKSELFIFSDGYKNEIDKKDVLEVRKYLKTIKGFKEVTIFESQVNKGLADSIISGVSSIVDVYGKAIVLEDDVVISDDFLLYMNEALDFYKDAKDVWSISGYTPNLESLKRYSKDVYFAQRGVSWAWATWGDRWIDIDWEMEDWGKFKKDKKLIEKFKLGGNDMYKMLELQMLGKLDSWAIRWCYNQFKYQKLTVFPKCSKAINIGFEDEKASNTTGHKWSRFDVELCSSSLKLERISLDNDISKEFQQVHNITLYTKIGFFLKKYGGYKTAKTLLKKIIK